MLGRRWSHGTPPSAEPAGGEAGQVMAKADAKEMLVNSRQCRAEVHVAA